ncbi:hypothetical protein BSL78_20294 [Apostichopus japonicus]|uniref:Integrase catalytic domain-containing protein n=1 Tax=Stichopus japonicus TaxID=307972 RepID=A0A2G8K4A7_STIJA|nr:hypothetical protein BSL78_20294 [Apostichopus japonicus]
MTDPGKVDAVKKWPTPKDKGRTTNVQHLPGRREHQQAFDTLKSKLCSRPILAYADFKLPFEVEIDASFLGLGAVLSQIQNGKKCVIAYASRTLRGPERNMEKYSSMKLELLGMKWAITEKFRDYLLGSTFVIYTDNNPLAHLKSAKLDAVSQRWVGALAAFEFSVAYKPGKSNQAADALSRRPVDKVQNNHVSSANYVHTARMTTLPANLQRAPTTENPVHVSALTSLPMFPGYDNTQLAELQQKDKSIARLLHYITTNQKPTPYERAHESEDVVLLCRQMNKIKTINGLLYRVTEDKQKQLILPRVLRNDVLVACHDQAGHQGSNKTLGLVRSRCYWPKMTEHVTSWCDQCDRCVKAKMGPRIKEPLRSMIATRPNEILAIDFTILEKDTTGRENVLVMTDVFSKYTQAVATRNQTAETTAKVLVREWFTKFSSPACTL